MPFILLAVGLAFVLLEFFAPGALFAILGGGAIIGSVIWAGFYTSSVVATVTFALIAAIACYFVTRFGMREVRTRISLKGDQSGFTASKISDSLIGEFGKVVTDLKPSGTVEIGGVLYPAVSQKGYLQKGEKIEVLRTQMGHLIVR